MSGAVDRPDAEAPAKAPDPRVEQLLDGLKAEYLARADVALAELRARRSSSPRARTWLLAIGIWLLAWTIVGALVGVLFGAAVGAALSGTFLGAGISVVLSLVFQLFSPLMTGSYLGMVGDIARMLEEARRNRHG